MLVSFIYSVIASEVKNKNDDANKYRPVSLGVMCFKVLEYCLFL